MSLGLGLNRGEIVAGGFGPTGRKTFDVFGDSVSVAALISPGEGVKSTGSVRQTLGEEVGVEAMDPLRRGGRELSVYRVV